MPKILTAVTFLLFFFVAAIGSIAQADDTKTPAVTAEDRVLGKANAPMAIIEFASLTCPHCAAFDKETLPQIRKNGSIPARRS